MPVLCVCVHAYIASHFNTFVYLVAYHHFMEARDLLTWRGSSHLYGCGCSTVLCALPYRGKDHFCTVVCEVIEAVVMANMAVLDQYKAGQSRVVQYN